MKRHLAESILISSDGTILIDGEPLPFFVLDDLEVEVGDHQLPVLRIGVPTDVISVWTRDAARKIGREIANAAVKTNLGHISAWVESRKQGYAA